ncbi:MAG: hypothetical protein AAGA85_02550 [Bacteroidota bacterium]
MIKAPPLLLPVLVWLMIVSCSQLDDDVSTSPNLQLALSTDTVRFDTLFTERTSITKRLRIFNDNKEDLIIDRIGLGAGNDSFYKLIVNGKEGKEITGELLRGEDSLLVLIDVTIDPMNENLPFLVKDSIEIQWNGNMTDVKLIAWGQDAIYLDAVALCDVVFTAERPYVIERFLRVDSLCTWELEPGARVYLDNGASIEVLGKMIANGDSGNHVIFRNTRFDPGFLEAPGQWGGILFQPGSRDNRLSYTTIENAVTAISTRGVNDPSSRVQISIDHSIIRHMFGAGIQAFTSELDVSNTLIHNCGAFVVSVFVGGDYRFDHCTMTNQPNFFIREEPSFAFLDNLPGESFVDDLSLEITNSILWGPEEEVFFLGNAGGAVIDTLVRNNIIKAADSLPGNFASQEFNFPGFDRPFLFEYNLDSVAFARDRAPGSLIPDDIRGLLRDSIPDIGAYERFDGQ